MNTAATLLTGLALAVLPTAVTLGPARAAAPYPKSTLITGISWDVGSYQSGGNGGDIWPVTWAADGALVTAWGDGVIGCPSKASYGVARIASVQPGTALITLHCGPGPTNKGKIMALLSTGGDLYARFGPQGTSPGYPIWKSTDGGRSWSQPSAPLPFIFDTFVQFGRDNTGAPGGYAYALAGRTTVIQLLRVRPGSLQSAPAYEYFSGTATAPVWSSSSSKAKPIFADPAGTWRPTMTYNPGLKRYLLVVAHSKVVPGSGNKIGIFEAPKPWGPWRTVSYVNSFLGIQGGGFWGMGFPIKWQADGGRTLWATFSCHNGDMPGACGRYHDRFNLVRARLTVTAVAGS